MLSTFGSFVTAINKCLLYEIKCEVHLKIGIVLPQVGQRATKENVIQMANLAEKEDIDSLWVFERLLWPLNPQTPYPGSPDGSLPVESQTVLDPLETLAFVGGLILTAISLSLGEYRGLELSDISWQSWIALVYLILIVTVVGFTDFYWLLRVTTPSLANTFAYVSPVIAVILGWL